MALRSTSFWKQVASRLRTGGATYATSTQPRLKAYSPALEEVSSIRPPQGKKGDLVPVFVVMGMIATSATLGVHSAYQQLRNSPTVRVSKKMRETLPEVECPEKVVDEAERFIKKSLFRKVAHVQEFDRQDAMPDPIRKDVYAYRRSVETLKSVGVDPKPHA